MCCQVRAGEQTRSLGRSQPWAQPLGHPGTLLAAPDLPVVAGACVSPGLTMSAISHGDREAVGMNTGDPGARELERTHLLMD